MRLSIAVIHLFMITRMERGGVGRVCLTHVCGGLDSLSCRDISALTDSDIKIILGEAPVAGFIVEAPAADAPLSPEHIEDVRTALVLLAEQLSQLGYQTLYLKSLVNSQIGSF